MRGLCIAVILFGWLGMAVAAGPIPGEGAVAFQLTSNSFGEGKPIPVRFTCQGEDASPDLHWNGAPAQTRSFALIVDDPDAPHGTWVHWVVYDLPGGATSLPSRSHGAPAVGHQGRNSFQKIGYNGPCPPPGAAHHYVFHLYALSSDHLGLPEGAGRDQVDKAMQGKIVAETKLTGTYKRQE